jgi:hypothetical protein
MGGKSRVMIGNRAGDRKGKFITVMGLANAKSLGLEFS